MKNNQLSFRYAHSKFIENIYNYCDKHVGKSVLVPVFMNLWPNINFNITKKELAVLTSEILYSLIEKKVIKDVFEKKFENFYAMYEILPSQI